MLPICHDIDDISLMSLQIRVVMARQVTDSNKMNSVGASGREKSSDSLEIFTTTDRHGNPLKVPPANDTKEDIKNGDSPKVVIPPKASSKKPHEENDYRPYTKESSYDKMKRLVLPSSSFPRTEEIEPREQF